MTPPKTRMQTGASGAVASPFPELPREESFHAQPVAIQNNVLYNNPRAALVTIPRLMDNPLYESRYEAFFDDTHTGLPGNCYPLTSHATDQERHDRRTPLSRLSLDESKVAAKPSRRQSWSLSSRDYEGMWRTVQENVFKSTRDSMTALEDFKQFRQKLADLKQVKDEVSAPPPTPTVLTPSGSIRSLNLGSVSTRSLNLSPSRPTSPLQRLSVITSRKTVSGLNPQRDSSRRGGAQFPPTVHRFALSMRAEGLFKLPNPASISPLTTDLYSSPPRPQVSSNSVTNNSSVTMSSKRRFFSGGRAAESKKAAKPVKPALAASKEGRSSMGSKSPRASRTQRSSGILQTRTSVATAVSNEVESFMNSCSPRSLAALNTISPRISPRNAPQQQLQQAPKKKSDKISMTSSCSPRGKDMKGRCIHIPRPMCYSAHILD